MSDGSARPDVASRYGVRSLENAGFLCRFLEPLRGTQVSLIARRNGVDYDLGHVPTESVSVEHPELAAHDYPTWLRNNESRLHWQPSEAGQRLWALAALPTISVILPTYNTRLYHLDRCITSVTTQLYPLWELCITDDASSDLTVRRHLLSQAENEPRIRLSFQSGMAGFRPRPINRSPCRPVISSCCWIMTMSCTLQPCWRWRGASMPT